MNDKIDDITGQEEVLTIHKIEETVEKEKKEGSEDVDVTKVERAVMEEDLKLVAEASDANISKLEVEEKREHKVEETKDKDIKEVCGDTKLASLSVDTEKYITAEEHTNTDISLHTTGETTTEEKAETVNEMEESVITSVDKDAEKKITEEESTINDQSRIIYKGDESGMLEEHEVHEIIKDNNEKDESDEVKPNNEVKDSKSEFTEPFEAREKGPVAGSTERSTHGSMDIDAKSEDANFIKNEDNWIPAASETKELENEMHKETPLTRSEDYEETTNETPLGIVLDDKQEECSAMLPEETELKTNEGYMAANENQTTYENIENSTDSSTGNRNHAK
ncbi:hypothetical protein OIU84_024841 [Salix udensis]|uniref:Uncharacterized protein n=1 Tax=Salix udensis TaxID=889485 RepID=A0AAD6KI73_9ROSI|nr:hypothetical protein OIU84_024841 [Salix udensis]